MNMSQSKQTIRAGSKVRILCGVSKQTANGFVYHKPGSTLIIRSSNTPRSWNLEDEAGNTFNDVPDHYLDPLS